MYILGFRDIKLKLDQVYNIQGFMPHCKVSMQPDSDDEVVNSNQIPVKEGNLSRCVTKVSIRF